MTDFLHVSFATDNFSQSAGRLSRSATRFGVQPIEIYTPGSDAVKQMLVENPWLSLDMRGAGYWLWKAYILLDALDRVPEGCLVLYTDVAVCYVAPPAVMLKLAEGRDIVLFNNHFAEWTQAMYTKRDCLVLLDADRPEDWQRRQLDAAFQLYRAGPRAREFLTELREAMRDPRVLTDNVNSCGKPNLPGFRDHRHDQSVLTIMAARHGIETFRSPSADMSEGDMASAYPKIFHHHRRRDVGFLRYQRRRLKDAIRTLIFGHP